MQGFFTIIQVIETFGVQRARLKRELRNRIFMVMAVIWLFQLSTDI